MSEFELDFCGRQNFQESTPRSNQISPEEQRTFPSSWQKKKAEEESRENENTHCCWLEVVNASRNPGSCLAEMGMSVLQ